MATDVDRSPAPSRRLHAAAAFALTPLLLAGAFACVAPGQDGEAPKAEAPKPAAAPQRDDHEALEHAMEELEEGYKALRRATRDEAFLTTDESRAAALTQLQKMQLAAIKSKPLTPPLVARIEDAAARAKQLDAYRVQMCALIRTLLDLEEAVLAKDAAKAKELLKKAHDAEESGHDQFKGKKKKRRG